MRTRENRYLQVVVCLVLTLGLALPAAAQRIEDAKPRERTVEPPDVEKVVAEQMEFLKRELTLEEKQVAKIETLLRERQRKLNEHLGYTYETLEAQVAVRKKLHAIQVEAETKMAAILTKEQMARYEELKQEEYARRLGQSKASTEDEPADKPEGDDPGLEPGS